MLNIRWRKIILISVLLGIGISAAIAQGYKQGINYRDFQNKPYYFGLSFGYNQSNFQVIHSKDFILNDSLRIAQSITGPGFVVGIITNIKLGHYFDLRVIPAFSFSERNIEYTETELTGGITTNRIESTLIEIPFMLRYKSEPFRDVRLFVLGGMKYAFDISSKSRTKRFNDLIKVSPHDFAVELGAGIQFFLPYFIFSPEIKVSQGIGNVLIYKSNFAKSSVLDKILSRTFTITFHFEG